MAPRLRIDLDQAVEALERPIPPSGDVLQGVENLGVRVVGRLARWWDPLVETRPERNTMAREFNQAAVQSVLSGSRIGEPELRAMIRHLEGEYNKLLNVTEDEAQAALEHKRMYTEVPATTMADLRKSQKALSIARSVLARLRAKLPPSRGSAQSQRGGRGQGGGSVPAPQPPAPAPQPPAPAPQPPAPAARKKVGPAPAPQLAPMPPPPEEPQGSESDREEALADLERELEEARRNKDAEEAEWGPQEDALKAPLRELGRKKNLNQFTPPDETGLPPPPLEKHSPSMDERNNDPDKLKNPPPPLYIIKPPLQGYYRVSIMDRFNSTDLEWTEEHNERPYVQGGTVPNEHKIKGKLNGKITLPLPAGYTVDANSLRSNDAIKITQDERGIVYLESQVLQNFEIYFGEVDRIGDRIPPTVAHREDMVIGDLLPETEAMLQSVTSMTTAEKVKAIAEYVQSTIEYSNEEAYNYIYKADPARYFQAIEEHKKADCDVANTYFIALCRRAGVPSRLVLGHRIDGARNGKAEITYSGHGWAEVWDAEDGCWKSTDATPPGEPNNNKGEPLETGNREEGIDIKPTPQPNKKHSSQQAQDLKRALQEAQKRNRNRHLSAQEVEDLKGKVKELKKAQAEEQSKSFQEDIDLLNQQATALEKDGKSAEAQALRDQARTLQGKLEQYKRDPDDAALKQELHEVLDRARLEMERTSVVELAKLRLCGLLGKLSALTVDKPK